MFHEKQSICYIYSDFSDFKHLPDFNVIVLLSYAIFMRSSYWFDLIIFVDGY